MNTRRTPVWDHAPDECTAHEYHDRAQLVYWKPSPIDACRAGGLDHSSCLLNRGHDGPHFGNGYDAWGPKGAWSWQ